MIMIKHASENVSPRNNHHVLSSRWTSRTFSSINITDMGGPLLNQFGEFTKLVQLPFQLSHEKYPSRPIIQIIQIGY